MKLISSLILVILTISCVNINDKNNQKKLEKSTIKSIDSIFSEFDNLNTPGYAIAIVKEKSILYKKGYGVANLDYNIPIKTNTSFDIASVSKQFTAACIALLILDGKLTLDTPVQDYIPDLSKYKDTIRVKHLIYNTSGLVDYFKLPRKNINSWLDFYYFDTDEAIKTSLTQNSLSFKPGEKWDYSNVNFMLLTKIIEKVSGIPFNKFIKERIFFPLEMKNTFVNNDITSIVKNRATPYNPRTTLYIDAYKKEGIYISKDGNWIKHHRNAPHYGGSGIISTVDDLIKWEQNFFTQKLWGDKFYEIMHNTPSFSHGINNQAFGLYFSSYKEKRFVAWEGSAYGISSQIIRFPDQKIAIIVLSNLGSGKASTKANKIADVLIKESML